MKEGKTGIARNLSKMSSLRQNVERFLCYTIENSAEHTKKCGTENRKAKPATGGRQGIGGLRWKFWQQIN